MTLIPREITCRLFYDTHFGEFMKSNTKLVLHRVKDINLREEDLMGDNIFRDLPCLRLHRQLHCWLIWATLTCNEKGESMLLIRFQNLIGNSWFPIRKYFIAILIGARTLGASLIYSAPELAHWSEGKYISTPFPKLVLLHHFTDPKDRNVFIAITLLI